jgi:hypothetical protein
MASDVAEVLNPSTVENDVKVGEIAPTGALRNLHRTTAVTRVGLPSHPSSKFVATPKFDLAFRIAHSDRNATLIAMHQRVLLQSPPGQSGIIDCVRLKASLLAHTIVQP